MIWKQQKNKMADSIVISNDRTEPSWISYIRGRIQKNKNFIVLISGQTGSGKSWAGLSVAKMLNPDFSANRIVFGLRGLMNLINSGETFKAGTCFVWDEFQIDAGNRNWQSLTNKLLNSLLSTFRHRRFVLIITAPFSDFLDSQSRKLIHAEFETMKIDYQTKRTKLKCHLLQYNSRYRKFYYKYLRVRDRRGLVAPLKAWNVPCPSKELIEGYEKLKSEFTTKLNASIQAQLDELDPVIQKNKQKPLTEQQEKVLRLMDEYKDANKVIEIMKLHRSVIYNHISQARKKGWTTENIAEYKGCSENSPENTPIRQQNSPI